MLRITTLGTFGVERGDAPIAPHDWKTQKNVALCKLLITHRNRTLTREQLIEWLWPDLAPNAADRSLRVAVSQVRRTLEPERPPRSASSFIQTRAAGYAWAPTVPVWIDADEFDELVCRCEDPDAEPQQQIEWGEQARRLYQGDFLPADRYADWSLAERERLRERYLRLLGWLATQYATHDQPRIAIQYCQESLRIDPHRETVWRDLMRYYYEIGEHGKAVETFQRCQRVLAEALEADPSPETIALYKEVRAYGRSADEVAHRPTNLPMPLTSFVGRRREMARLARDLASGVYRLITIVGPGGMGKSRLAIEVARRVCGFRHGVFSVSLESVDTPEGIAPTVAASLDLAPESSAEPLAFLVDFLAHKQMLLILDGCEHLAHDMSVVQTLLQRAPDVQVLATSRIRLDVPGERVVALDGLPVSEAADGSALDLFIATARRVVPDLHLSQAERTTALHVCRLLEGVPLAVELAASWLRSLDIAQLAAELHRSLDLLHVHSQARPRRQRSLQAAFEHSWRLLSPAEQAILCRLAIFRGAFDRTAAEAVAQASLSDLLRLVDWSLMTKTDHHGYRLHLQVRQYAWEKLTALGGSQILRQHHCAYFMHALRQWRTDLEGGRQGEVMAAIARYLPDVQAAWQEAQAQGAWKEMAQAVHTLYRFFDLSGRFGDGVVLLEETVSNGRATRIEPPILGTLLAHLGALYHRLGHYTEARNTLSAALEADVAGNTRTFALNNLGLVAYQTGDLRLAEEYFQQSLLLCRQSEDAYASAVTLNYLGLVCNRQGSLVEAWAYFEESLAIKRTLGDRRGLATTFVNLGRLYLQLGNDDGARALFTQSMAIYEDLGHRRGVARVLNQLGWAAHVIGDRTKATDWFMRALRLAQQIGAYPVALESLVGLGRVALDRGDEQQATQLLASVVTHPASEARVRAQAEQILQHMHRSGTEGDATTADDLNSAILARMHLYATSLDLDRLIAQILCGD